MAFEPLTHQNGVVVTDGNTVIYSNQSEMILSGFLDLENVKNDLYIGFKAKSASEELECHHRLTVQCFTEDRILIPDCFNNFVSNPVLVTSAGRNTIRVKDMEILSEFKNHQDDQYAALAFFFDGKTNHLPNFVITNKFAGNIKDRVCHKTETVFKITNEIILDPSISLPYHILEQINNGFCIVRVHREGGTYTYPLGGCIPVSNTWTEYGTVFSPTQKHNDNKSAKIGTRYIKIGFLCNWGRKGDVGELFIKDFRVCMLL